MSGGDVFRQGAERKKSAGVASLRGQGTPAYPARLRSERARNSPKTLRAASAGNSLKIFPAAGPRKHCKFGLRIFCRRKRSGGCEPGSGGLPFHRNFFSWPQNNLVLFAAANRVYFSSSLRRNS